MGTKLDLLAPARVCACFNLRKAARAVTQLYETVLEPSGVRVTQFSVLVALARNENVPLGRLAEAMVMDRTTLTRNLRPLERRGWIRDERGTDRRERYLSLTHAGRAALERALPLWRSAQARVVEALGERRVAALMSELGGLVAVAQGRTPTPPR